MAGEDGIEAALVVVVPLGVVIVFSADIYDGVAFGEDFGFPRADKLGVEVGGEKAQHGNREGLVGMEVATGAGSVKLNSDISCLTCAFR